MKTRILYAIVWDDRITLCLSIFMVAVLSYKGLWGLVVITGCISILAHVVLIALSRSILSFEVQQCEQE